MSQREEHSGASRRRVCQVTGVAACGIAAGGGAVLFGDFLAPRVLFEPPTRFILGAPEGVDLGEVVTKEDYRAYVIRRPDGFCALSSVCTHLGCITRYLPGERVIACPCHGSRFDLDGEVLSGPAPRPLRWLEVGLSSAGEIAVDTGREVPLGTVYRL